MKIVNDLFSNTNLFFILACKVEHKYNTRSRQRRIDKICNAEPEIPREMCCPKSPRNCSPCGCKHSTAVTTRAQKILKAVKIALIIGLIILLTSYLSDQTTNVFKREINALSSHIHLLEKNLHNVLTSKIDVEKQLSQIVSSLPDIKNMAYSLRDDMKKCTSRRAAGSYDEQLRSVVRDELEQYNADKTGRTDFALESSGGSIISIKDTKSFIGSSLSIFGIPLCESSNNPRAMIQPGVMPGQCWAFQGSSGSAIIKLVTDIYVTGVSIEHIARSISPTGVTNTAPNEFSIWGLHSPDDVEGFFFGQFKYDITGSTLQYFPVTNQSAETFEIIELKVLSNHGHPDFTCIYRLRVHGDLENNDA